MIYGALGLIKLTSTGTLNGTWVGMYTGRAYKATMAGQVQWVDRRDAPRLLDWMDAERRSVWTEG